MVKDNKLRRGDWIKGVTNNDELLHGYLEHVQANHIKVDVKVAVSDNQEIIGKTLQMNKGDVEKLDHLVEYTDQQLETLIDLALSSKDQSWFMELSAKLNARRQNDKSTSRTINVTNDYEKSRF